MSDNVVPIIAPSRAESILAHRTLVPETTRQELLRVLRGESVAAAGPKEAG